MVPFVQTGLSLKAQIPIFQFLNKLWLDVLLLQNESCSFLKPFGESFCWTYGIKFYLIQTIFKLGLNNLFDIFFLSNFLLYFILHFLKTVSRIL